MCMGFMLLKWGRLPPPHRSTQLWSFYLSAFFCLTSRPERRSSSDAPSACTLLTDGLLQSSGSMEPINGSRLSACPPSIPKPPCTTAFLPGNSLWSILPHCERLHFLVTLWLCSQLRIDTDGLSVISSSTQSVLDSNMLHNWDTSDAVDSSAAVHYIDVMTSKKEIFYSFTIKELKGSNGIGNQNVLFLTEMVLGSWFGAFNVHIEKNQQLENVSTEQKEEFIVLFCFFSRETGIHHTKVPIRAQLISGQLSCFVFIWDFHFIVV